MSLATAPVILILGSGPNVGRKVAEAFAAEGYKVAVTSRRAKETDSTENQLVIPCDLSDPSSVAGVFSKVKDSLGVPSVIVYNAAATTPGDASNPFSISLDDFTKDLSINTTSAFAAAQQAVRGFDQLPDSASKTFIYTGNKLNVVTMAPLLSLGVGKSATAHMIQSAAAVFAERGYKFYYGDERTSDGSPTYSDVDGEAHARHYLELAQGTSQGPWQQTFVKGNGYKSFPAK